MQLLSILFLRFNFGCPTLTPQSPCCHRGFLFLQQHQALPKGTFNTWHHCPAGRRFLSRFYRPNKPDMFPPTAWPSLLLLRLYAAFIASTHSLITSLSIAITDAVGSSKSHRNLLPLLWNLIEPHIKRKRQLLLPWRYTLSLSSLSTSCFNQPFEHP
jgi:hypothetical protein